MALAGGSVANVECSRKLMIRLWVCGQRYAKLCFVFRKMVNYSLNIAFYLCLAFIVQDFWSHFVAIANNKRIQPRSRPI